ncbi:MAG: type II secretion system secretin GspD [Phycisphaerales bacterium]|nr:MAG: type II secretion system secretin GspD [Phycisphaerales bacterium]
MPVANTGVHLPALDEPGMADQLVSINFDQVDIRTVLRTMGDITGINFVVDDRVSGTVTVMSPTKIRFGDIYGVLESILEVQGYAAVPAGSLVKIVPRAEAAKRNLQVRIGGKPEDIPKTDSVVTQIIPLGYADVTEVSRIIQPLLAAGAQMATYPRTNSIVITDTSSNIHHIAMIIQNLDVTGSEEQVTVLPLEYASAEVLSEQISRIMQKSRGGSPQAPRTRSTPEIDTDIKILPDVRTNAIIVVANAQDTEVIAELAAQLDVERPVGTGNVHVVYLENAQAKEVAQSLTAAMANLRISGAVEGAQPIQVTADEGTNSVIVSASPQDYKVIAEIVEKLDIVREQVLVEMLIMEVSEDGLTEIGIDWATLDQAVDDSVRYFGMTNFGPRVDFLNGDLEGLAVGAWKGAGDNLMIGALLHALEKESGVNILSTPHILTSNHNKAKIIVGENRPFVMQSRVTETTDFITPTVIKSYEYKDVGISLEITPHISQGGLIRLEIDSEFTKLIEDVTVASADTPTTAKRQAQTVVSMNSGSTVVIGGLIRDDKVTVVKKIPILGDVPVIGALFRLNRDRLQKTNLLIFITPHVMGDQQDLETMTQQKQDQMESVLNGFEQEATQR